MEQVYEAYGLRENGDAFTVEVMECASDVEAKARAADFAAQWRAAVRVYAVPCVNTSSASSFDLWPNDMRPVAEISCWGRCLGCGE
jgi:hypothetical protein